MHQCARRSAHGSLCTSHTRERSTLQRDLAAAWLRREAVERRLPAFGEATKSVSEVDYEEPDGTWDKRPGTHANSGFMRKVLISVLHLTSGSRLTPSRAAGLCVWIPTQHRGGDPPRARETENSCFYTTERVLSPSLTLSHINNRNHTHESVARSESQFAQSVAGIFSFNYYTISSYMIRQN